MQATQELILRMADNALILGHRNSEWTGLGPVLEEDIAFSSMAQDKIGHALALYQILESEFGMAEPNKTGFERRAKDFLSAQFVELSSKDYAFALMRHFLYDHQDFLRFSMLEQSTFKPIADLSRKIRGELKYHIMHANTWVKQLSKGNEESKIRIQTALNEAMPFALGLFEQSPNEEELIKYGIFEGEIVLKTKWTEQITNILSEAGLKVPDISTMQAVEGGRKGIHSEELQPLLNEMTEVFSADPEAEW